jgi:magnesium-transporting ATPase (P-type)
MLPFDQDLKRKIIVRKTNDPEIVRVFVQGAPETVVSLCSWTLGNGDKVEMGP